MRLLLVDNAHLYQDKNGNYYAPSIYSYGFLQRYLNVFEEVRFMGKVYPVTLEDTSKYTCVSGKGVEVYGIPWYQGLKDMWKKAHRVIPAFWDASKGCDCIIFRIAQLESFFVYLLGGKKKPYAVEVINDPEAWMDLPAWMKKFSGDMTRRMIRNAKGAAFVTKEVLQKKYAAGKKKKGAFTANYSSVELDESMIANKPLRFPKNGAFRIIHISNLINNHMKGHTTLINAAKIVIDKGYDVSVEFVGEGDKVSEFRNYAERLGIGQKIEFVGRTNSVDQLFNELKKASLMVFPSVTEGLPRVLVEAMAVGLPCLSTPVGGIPELLDRKYLFEPDDADGFGNEIARLMDNPREMEKMSGDNIAKACEYKAALLNQKRSWFYKKLRESIT